MSQEVSVSIQETTLPWAGIATALCWSISPIFIRKGLEDLSSPLLGVTVGMIVNVMAYGVILYLRRDKWQRRPISRESLNWQIWAGVFVGLATWARWVALDLSEVAVVLAIGRFNVPIVIILSLFMLDQKQERITARLWLGAALIVIGSLLLIFYR
ncbi:MAG: EamA family transporter [Chloroflexi bacterium]|nr:EamA family transporter [Chloroflexota bacterium]